MSGDNRQESVAGQSLQLEVGGRPHRGRTPHPAQQRDIAEAIPRTEYRDQATVSNHIGLARLDHVEAVGGVTLAKYLLAGRHMDRFQATRKMFDSGQR